MSVIETEARIKAVTLLPRLPPDLRNRELRSLLSGVKTLAEGTTERTSIFEDKKWISSTNKAFLYAAWHPTSPGTTAISVCCAYVMNDH
jgi:hypothetical protein